MGLQGKDASMGLASGVQPLPFGHSAEAAVDIEGLAVSLNKSHGLNSFNACVSYWKIIYKSFGTKKVCP